MNHEFSFLWFFGSGRPQCPGFSRRVKLSFVRFCELVDIFRQVPARRPVQGFCLAFFPRILEPTEFAPEVRIFASLPATGPFSPNLSLTYRALGQLDGGIRSQFANFSHDRLSEGNLWTHNPFERSLSTRPLTLCHHLSFTSYWLVTRISVSEVTLPP